MTNNNGLLQQLISARQKGAHYMLSLAEISDVIDVLSHPKPEPSGDVKAALDALTFVARTLGWLEVVPPYGDAVSRTKECDKAIRECETIRAALTAKQQSVNEDIIETPANDALKILRLVNNWSEIETAPKDGTEILLGRFEDGVIEDVIKDYWYEDRVIADWAEYPAVFDKSPTHWAMLPLILDVTAPPTPVTKQQPDVNSVFDSPELMETLAEIEHERWSGWMRYQFEVANEEKNQHWKSLMNTPYADLQEWSKESDRREVRKTLDAIKKFIGSTVQQPVNKELLDACKVVLGHMTCGMDGEWRDCDPIVLLHEAIAHAEQKGGV